MPWPKHAPLKLPKMAINDVSNVAMVHPECWVFRVTPHMYLIIWNTILHNYTVLYTSSHRNL